MADVIRAHDRVGAQPALAGPDRRRHRYFREFRCFLDRRRRGADQQFRQERLRRNSRKSPVTGSRIVRRDLESNSPLTTVDKEKLEDNTFISVEEALNDLPQFMVGGVNNSSAAVTSLQSANALDGGRGSGDAFNGSLLDPAGTIGQVVPGAANVNLRGLGANRSLTLINGHRGMPSNASMTVDLNTIPTIAIGNIEVITGGASAVYGADALAGVTNIKLRNNFEGLSLRVRSGVNEVGDGEEYQVSALMGAKLADGKGSAMMGIEYSRREVATWGNRSFFREVLESPYAGSGDLPVPLGRVLLARSSQFDRHLRHRAELCRRAAASGPATRRPSTPSTRCSAIATASTAPRS